MLSARPPLAGRRAGRSGNVGGGGGKNPSVNGRRRARNNVVTKYYAPLQLRVFLLL